MKHKLLLLAILPFSFFLAAFAVLALRAYSATQARGQIYTLASAPDRPVAIVFGAQVYDDGSPSPMLADRVETAVRLYQAGKAKALLMSGDNHVATYNEPEAMRQYALKLGMPDSAIVLDYAGFRTYDSCYRARDIFKVDRAILVTQAFHLDRALLTCNLLGVNAIGVAADEVRPEGYDRYTLWESQMRELPSTSISVLDLLVGAKPRFLGDPLPILVAQGSSFNSPENNV